MDATDFHFAELTPADLAVYFNESTFGLAEVSQVLEERRFANAHGLKGLEIGSGVGILLARLKEQYPQHTWEGIEPTGPGFARSGAVLDRIQQKLDLSIHRTTFEDFSAPDATYDFIFSVNVLEHMASWRDCIAKAFALLRPGGKAVFLCPNYSFPYEPHYALPIVLTKSLTARLFRGRIEAHDRKYDADDLWTSLNFIKKRDVIAFCRERSIPLSFDEAVVTRMVEKLSTDAAFAERQRVIAPAAKLLHQVGVTRLVETFPLRLLSPYAKIVIG